MKSRLGTSGVVFAATDQPTIEPEGRLHAFCHAVPGKWHLMGVMLSAGGSLRWHRDTQAAGVPFDDLLKPAADVPPGSDGDAVVRRDPSREVDAFERETEFSAIYAGTPIPIAGTAGPAPMPSGSRYLRHHISKIRTSQSCR